MVGAWSLRSRLKKDATAGIHCQRFTPKASVVRGSCKYGVSIYALAVCGSCKYAFSKYFYNICYMGFL